MTTDSSQITTTEEFRRRLESILAEAIENDVAVGRGWTCKSAVGPSDYEPVSTAVTKPDNGSPR